MDRLDHVADRGAALDGHHGLGNQVARAVADDPAADDALRLRGRRSSGSSLGAADGVGPAAGSPRELGHFDRASLPLGLGFRQSGPGDFGIGEDDGRNGPRLEGRRLAGQDLDGHLALVARLVGQHRLAGRVADGQNVRIGWCVVA